MGALHSHAANHQSPSHAPGGARHAVLCQQLYEACLRCCALLLPPCLLLRHSVSKALEEQLLPLGVADGL